MRNRRIELTSGLLRDHFSNDSVMLDMFIANYNAVKLVLDNPEKFPKADYGHYANLMDEFVIAAPIEIMLEEFNAH